MKLTARHIEFALAKHFDWRRNLLVPNVHWGFGLNYEADLLVLTPARRLWEVEIKVTPEDLRNDARKKPWAHGCKYTDRLYFAFPEAMAKYSDLVPDDAGILTVSGDSTLLAKMIRPAKLRPQALSLSDEQVQTLWRLAAIRIWDLKLKLIQTQAKLKERAA